MARAKAKAKKYRTAACKHLVQLNEISNSGFPLCSCGKRNLVISPFNIVCQVCVLYRGNSAGISHDEIFKADDAPEYVYNVEDLNLRIDVNLNPTDKDDIFGKESSDEYDDEDDEEYDFEEEIEGPVIGAEKEVEESDLDFHDEAEEAFSMDDEDDELDEYDDDIFGDDDEEGEDDGVGFGGFAGGEDDGGGGTGIDFEEEVLSKIKDLGDKELCPYCKKAKKSVVRHLYRCAKCPDEIKEAMKEWKKSQTESKEPAKKKAAPKKAAPKKSEPKAEEPAKDDSEIEWDSSLKYLDSEKGASGALIYFTDKAEKFKDILIKKDAKLKRKREGFKSLVDRADELKNNVFIELNVDEGIEIEILLRNLAKSVEDSAFVRFYKK